MKSRQRHVQSELGRSWLLFALAMIAALLGAAQPQQPERSGWVARTDYWTITWDEFSRRYSTLLTGTGSQDHPTLREALLDNLINENLLLRNDPEAVGSWRQANMETVERIRNQALLAYLKDHDIYAARHLYARTVEEARELLALLRSGVTFETLASQIFTDSTLRNSGGFLGYFSWGDMDPAFEDAAYRLQVGEISEPIATASGYSIIRVDDRIPHPLLTENQFIQRRAHVERVVRIRKKRPAERSYLQAVLPAKSVAFHPDGLRSVSYALQRPVPEAVRMGSASGPCVTLPDRMVRCEEIIRLLSRLPADQRMEITSHESLRAAIRGVILQERLLRIAQEKGYDTVDVVREAMQRGEESLYLRSRLQEIVTNADVSDEDLHRYYEQQLPDFMTESEMQVQELIVGRKELADSLKMLLDRGFDLADLARRFSLRRSTGEQGGTLPSAPLSRYGGMRDLLWQAPLGAIIGPVPIGEAIGLFRVVSRHEGHPRSFPEAKNQVLRMVQFERQRTILTSHFDDIRRRVPVTIDRPRLMTTPLVGASPE